MSDRAGARGEEGFSLVEALVALTIVSLLSLLTLSALQFGIQAWRRGSETALKLDDRIHAEGFLRQLLSQTSPRFVARSGGTGYVDFEGRSTSLQLIAHPPRSLSGSGPWVFNVGTENKGGQTNLTFSSRPELAKTNTQQISQRVLIEDVGNVEFAYFGAKGQQSGWRGEWVRETSLPELIKITLRKGAAGFETSFTIRPRIDVDVSCIHDLLSRRCRGR
jgi:general secretion pathway protein J